MKKLALLLFVLNAPFFQAQSRLQGGVNCILLDSVVKADRVKQITIYCFNQLDGKTKAERLGSSEKFKCLESLLVFESSNSTTFYNLEKVVYFSVSRKENQLDLFIQVN